MSTFNCLQDIVLCIIVDKTFLMKAFDHIIEHLVYTLELAKAEIHEFGRIHSVMEVVSPSVRASARILYTSSEYIIAPFPMIRFLTLKNNDKPFFQKLKYLDATCSLGHLSCRMSTMSEKCKTLDEQIYRPCASGTSIASRCAVTTSSMCTNPSRMFGYSGPALDATKISHNFTLVAQTLASNPKRERKKGGGIRIAKSTMQLNICILFQMLWCDPKFSYWGECEYR